MAEKGKSILRYPGGKTRAIPTILPIIEKQQANVLYSPFFGGGSLEFAFAAKDVSNRAVIAVELYEPLAVFWEYTLVLPKLVAKSVKEDFPLSKKRFKELQVKMDGLKGVEQAAAFYVVNRSSFSGSTNSGGMSPNHPRFTESSIERLENFCASNVNLRHGDAFEMFDMIINYKNPDEFSNCVIYADPPYYLNSSTLYGNNGNTHKDFDHKLLAEKLNELAKKGWKIILSYNDCETIRNYYKDFTVKEVDWKYGMNASKESSELLILSKGCNL